MKNYRVILMASLMVWSIGSAYAASERAQPDAAGGNVAESPAAKKLDPAVVQAKMQNLERQAALINQLTDKFQPDAAAQFGAGFNAIDWKRDFGARMLYQPLGSLSQALNAPNLSVAQSALVSSNTRAKHLTDDNWVTNFLPTPCRIVDTRSGGGGVLGPVYRYWTASTATASIIAAQGGNAAGCGNFPNAQGFILYVTVVPTLPGGPNFLTVQHNSSPAVPTTSTMNYYGQNIANFAITSCNGCGGGDGGFFAFASGNSPHVIIDLLAWTGTPAAPAPAPLSCVDVGMPPSALMTGGRTITATCAATHTATGASCDTSNSNAGAITGTYAFGVNGWNCESNNYPGNTTAFVLNGSIRCCSQ